MSQVLTGKPSVDKPWMQYYPEQLIKNLKVPSSTIGEYLAAACPGKDVTAIHYYGKDITWAQIETEVNSVKGHWIWCWGSDSDVFAFRTGIYLSSSGSRKNWCISSLQRQHN